MAQVTAQLCFTSLRAGAHVEVAGLATAHPRLVSCEDEEDEVRVRVLLDAERAADDAAEADGVRERAADDLNDMEYEGERVLDADDDDDE